MIAFRPVELEQIFNRYAGGLAPAAPDVEMDHSEWTQEDNGRSIIISASIQGDSYRKLFNGHFDGDYPSQSEADLALCRILAYWSNNDSKQMDRMFRKAKLYRPKWDKIHGRLTTYGQMTIQKAISWNNKTAQSTKTYDRGVFNLVQVGLIEAKPPQWLIVGLIERDSLALAFGDPGCGKSFWAIDLSLCTSTGTVFHGYKVEQGPVIYIAGEGRNGLKRRMIAWSIANKVPHDTAPLFVSSMPAAFTDAQMVLQVQAAIESVTAVHGPPVLIIIDTLARNFGPGDENSTRDMSQFIQALDILRAKSQATVLIVHHSGHGDKSRARGAMALKGALDAEYRLDKGDDGVIRMEATKMKEADHPKPIAFRLKTIPLSLMNENVTSAVLELTDYAPIAHSNGRVCRGSNQTKAIEILHNLYDKQRNDLIAKGHDPGTARISMDEWKLAMRNDDIKSNRIGEIVTSLSQGGMIIEDNGFVRPL